MDGARFGRPARVLLDELTAKVKAPHFLSYIVLWIFSPHEFV
jgi:hypothetical protein